MELETYSTTKSGSGRIKNARGFSLLEGLVALSILGGVSLGVAGLFRSISKQQGRADFVANLGMVRAGLTSVLLNHGAWDLTIKNNKAMSCLQNSTSCSQYAGIQNAQEFVLYNTDGSIYYSSPPIAGASMGYTATGASCTNFKPDPSCSLHVALKWYASCNPDKTVDKNCSAPAVYIQGTFSYVGPSMDPINWGNFNFTTVGLTGSSVIFAQACTSLSGTFSTTTGKCTPLFGKLGYNSVSGPKGSIPADPSKYGGRGHSSPGGGAAGEGNGGAGGGSSRGGVAGGGQGGGSSSSGGNAGSSGSGGGSGSGGSGGSGGGSGGVLEAVAAEAVVSLPI